MTGSHEFKRNQHYCESCKESFYPLDTELGLSGEGEASPDLERRILDFGVTTTFKEAEERWVVHYSKSISENFVRCVVDRCQHTITSARIRDVQEVICPEPEKSSKLLIVECDGGMVLTRDKEPWKESKLGVIFREENHVPSSENNRGCLTQARYVGHLGSVNKFKVHVAEALRVEKADKVEEIVWLGDGAPWIWNMAEELAPGAVQILDAMHAIEHGSACAKALFNGDETMEKLWLERVKFKLFNETPSALILELRGCLIGAAPSEAAAINELLNYYSNNADRMKYKQFKEKGLPIGSGAIESAHKHVVQKRMKLAGQHWNVRRARGMVELRAAYRTVGAQNLYDALNDIKRRTLEFGRRAA